MGSSDMKKLGSKIVAFQVVKAGQEPAKAPVPALPSMHEGVQRPSVLKGSTYKIKPQNIDSAIYVTINDVTLPDGTVRPYEIFINSKDTTALPWMIAMTRLMSAVFRKGGDCTFLVEELNSVFDPQGGYYGPGGVWFNSAVAHIGEVVKQHLEGLEMIKKVETKIKAEGYADLSNASVCGVCHAKAVVVMDGCRTCVSCGNAKCG